MLGIIGQMASGVETVWFGESEGTLADVEVSKVRPLEQLALTAIPESVLKQSSRSHLPMHGLIFWQHAALTKFLAMSGSPQPIIVVRCAQDIAHSNVAMAKPSKCQESV
jgi:hypothetical protein